MKNQSDFLQDYISPELVGFCRCMDHKDFVRFLLDKQTEYTCVYIISGAGAVFSDTPAKVLSEKHVYCFNRQPLLTVDSRKEFEAVVLQMKNITALNRYFSKQSADFILETCVEEDEELVNILFRSMEILQDSDSYMDEQAKKSILNAFILLYTKHIDTDEDRNQAKEGLAEKIKQYIDDNYQKDVSLSSISKHFYITVDYVSHIFKERFGIAPIKYLIGRRIALAKNLLMNTNHSVNAIAYEVGYDNPAYFSTLFRKTVGISPANYRLSIKRNM